MHQDTVHMPRTSRHSNHLDTSPQPNYYLFQLPITSSHRVKNLGILIDNQLTFVAQVASTVHSALTRSRLMHCCIGSPNKNLLLYTVSLNYICKTTVRILRSCLVSSDCLFDRQNWDHTKVLYQVYSRSLAPSLLLSTITAWSANSRV